jgi:hypothetical protein
MQVGNLLVGRNCVNKDDNSIYNRSDSLAGVIAYQDWQQYCSWWLETHFMLLLKVITLMKMACLRKALVQMHKMVTVGMSKVEVSLGREGMQHNVETVLNDSR